MPWRVVSLPATTSSARLLSRSCCETGQPPISAFARIESTSPQGCPLRSSISGRPSSSSSAPASEPNGRYFDCSGVSVVGGVRSGSVGTSMRSPSSTSLSRCSSGTPSMCPSTRIGIGPAISSTKSNSPLRQRLVEHRARELGEELAVALGERARREVAGEHAAPLRVQRRVGLHEVAARLEHVVGHGLDQRGAAVLRGVDRRVLEHLDDVVVARHAPEAVAVRARGGGRPAPRAAAARRRPRARARRTCRGRAG